MGIVVSAQEMVLTFNKVDLERTIDSIKVTNIETGNSATVVGEATVDLQAVLTSANSIRNGRSELTVYPNPFHENTTIEYLLQEAEELTVLLTNSLGQILANQRVELNQGIHRFKISTVNTGIYYVSMFSSQGQESCKIIALNKGISEDKIEYIGFENSAYLEKSVLLESGSLLHIELSSGNDKTIIADTPTESKTYEVEFHECVDADGKSYKIVQMGEQWWMAENLAYLPKVSPPDLGSLSESHYYVYDYSGKDVNEAKATDNYNIYGVLYNWTAAITACPNGWHLPTDSEWMIMEQTVGMSQSEVSGTGWRGTDEGAKLKATYGWDDNGNGTDNIGFSALPGGYRYDFGDFYDIGIAGYWESASEYDSGNSWGRTLFSTQSKFARGQGQKDYGICVRCLKD